MENPWAQIQSMHGTYGFHTRREHEYPTQRYDHLERNRSNEGCSTPNFSQRVYYNPQPSSQSFGLAQPPTPTSSSSACMQSSFFQDLEPLQETHGSQSALPSPEASPMKANLADFASGSRTLDGITFDGEPYPAEANNVYTTSPPKWPANIHTSYGNDGVPSPSAWQHDYSQDVQTLGMAPQSQDLSFSGSLRPLHNQYEHPYSPRERSGECKYHATSVRTLQGNMATSISLSEGQNSIMRPSSRSDCRDFKYSIPTLAVVKSKSAPPGLSLHGSLGELDTGTTLEEPQPPRSLSHKRWESTLNVDSSISKRRKTRKLTTAGKAHATAVRKSKGGACKLCRKKKIKCLHKLPEDRALHRALHTLATFDPDVRKTETGARPFDPMLSLPMQDLADLETSGLI